MNEQKESMVFYKAFFEAIEMNPDSNTKAECYKAIINYALNGELPETDDIFIKSIFRICKPSVDANTERYQKSIENGKKRGAPLGNQNARKNDNSMKLPEKNLSLSENKNNSIQNKNNLKTIQFNSNNLTVSDTVTDTETVTDTYTETVTDTKNFNVNENVNENENENGASIQNCSSNNFLSHQNINNINSNSYIPIGVSAEKFLSLSNKFKKYFPNKNNKIKNWKDINNINIKDINIEKLIAKIDTCDFVKERNYLGLEWALLNYDNIINGVYDNPQNVQKLKQHESYLQQNSFANGKDLNSLYDNIEEISKELEKEKQASVMQNPFKQNLSGFF